MSILQLKSPQSFPFDVRVGSLPLLSVGADVTVRATLLASHVSTAAVNEVDGFVEAFCMLAMSGGLSGDRIAPESSGIGDKSDVNVLANVLTWHLTQSRVDDRAALNLLNLFLFEHDRHPLAAVEILHSDAPDARPLEVDARQEDCYPAMYHAPFPVVIDEPISDGLSLTMTLTTPPTPVEAEAIELGLLMWSVAPSVGAFAVPNVDIHAHAMQPEQEIDVDGRDVLWRIERFRMHPAAIQSLVNCCIALSHQAAPIESLELS